MDETTFWNVMEDAHRVSSGRLRGQIDAMVEALAALPLDDILAFHDRFHAAHRAAATRPLLGAASILALACTPGGRACTPEGFSAFRAWLVARGRDVYERALSDPDSLAGFVTKTPAPTGRRLFYQVPGFLEAAPRAWERVTNLPAERMPARHAADMPEGLQPPSIDAMRAECPKLVAVVESRVARAHTAFAERILMRLVMTFWPDGAYALVAWEAAMVASPELRGAAARFEGLGFRHVCTYAAMRVMTAAGQPTPILCHVDADATIRALAYVAPKSNHTIFEFESDLADGCVLQTTNASAAAKFDRLPGILRETLPIEATAEEIFALHRARARVSAVSLVASMPATPDAVVRRSLALARRKYDDKNAKGWLTFEEFQRLTNSKLRDPAGAYREFRRLQTLE